MAELVASIGGEPESQPEFVCLLNDGLKPERTDYLWEAQGLFERFADAVMVGGWIADKNGQVFDGPLVLGFEGGCGCPDRGRPDVDPGYFTQMRKQHSVSAISSRFAVIRTSFLRDALANGSFQHVMVSELGPYLGKFALETNRRTIFSPFLRCDLLGEETAKPVEMGPVEPDHRYYPLHFGMTEKTAYRLGLRE